MSKSTHKHKESTRPDKISKDRQRKDEDEVVQDSNKIFECRGRTSTIKNHPKARNYQSNSMVGTKPKSSIKRRLQFPYKGTMFQRMLIKQKYNPHTPLEEAKTK